MRRRLIVGFIATYLSVLGCGLFCHAMNFRTGAHPLMYFIIWDMFCGWSPYNSFAHIIAEGESGTFYECAPGPWGSLRPWGAYDRHHYDPWNNHLARMGLNTLRHTEHEPIQKIWIVEECSMKKYDLPDAIWNQRYSEPKQPTTYYRVRAELNPLGEYQATYIAWAAYQNLVALGDNPRLRAESQKDRPMFAVDVPRPGRDVFLNALPRQALPANSFGAAPSPSSAPLGN